MLDLALRAARMAAALGLIVGCSSSSSSAPPGQPADGGTPAADSAASAGSSTAGDASGGPATADAGPPVGHLQIAPAALLLTTLGDTHALKLRATDPTGMPATIPVTWTSSRPSEVTVDAKGNVTAMAVPGSAVITVRAPGYTDASVLVIAAAVPAGSVLVDDEAVVAGPDPVDPNADVAPGALVTVTLHGVAAPAPGVLLIGRGERPVGGKVMSAMPRGSDLAVVLQLVAVDEVFKALKVDGEGPMAQVAPDPSTIVQPQTITTQDFMLGPLKCTATLSANLISGKVTPSLSDSTRYTVRFDLDDTGWHEATILTTGTMNVDITGEVNIMAGFTGSVACKLEIYRHRIPLPGIIGAVLGFYIPIGVKAGINGGAMTLPLTVGLQLKGPVTFTDGVSWRDTTGAVDVTDMTHDLELQPIFKPPPGDLPQVYGFGIDFGAYVGLQFGFNSFIPGKLAIDLLEGSLMGHTQEEMASLKTQFASPTYANTYSGKGTIEIKTGPGIARAAANLTKLETAGKVVSFIVKGKTIELPGKATSPTGTLMADQKNVEFGNKVNFTVHLDPGTLRYFGIDNVKAVDFYRVDPGATNVVLLSRVAASPGQTDFKASWTPTEMDIGDHTFFAAVETVVEPIVGTEPAPDTSTMVRVRLPGGGWEGTATITVTEKQNDVDHMVDLTGTATINYVANAMSTPYDILLDATPSNVMVTETDVRISHSMHRDSTTGCSYSDTNTVVTRTMGTSIATGQYSAFVMLAPSGSYSILFGFPTINTNSMQTTTGVSSGGGPSCPDMSKTTTTDDKGIFQVDGPTIPLWMGPANPTELMGSKSYDAPNSVPARHYDVSWDFKKN